MRTVRAAGLSWMASALAFACGCLAAAPAVAQGAAQRPQAFVVHVEHAVPDQIAAYEAATKEFVQLVEANRDVMPSFSFQALAGEDLSYAFVSPVSGFAEMGEIFGQFMALAAKPGSRFGELMERAGPTIDHIDEWVFLELPDASYVPAQPRLRPEEERYVEMIFYYVEPGREAAADALGADIRKVYAAKGFPYGYRVFKAALGADMPLYVATIPAKDPADLAALHALEREMLGADYVANGERIMAITRRMDFNRYWIRPDLSLRPAAAPAGR